MLTIEEQKSKLKDQLDEIQKDAELLLNNVAKLKEALEKVQTDDDMEEFDELSDELIYDVQFKHISLW